MIVEYEGRNMPQIVGGKHALNWMESSDEVAMKKAQLLTTRLGVTVAFRR